MNLHEAVARPVFLRRIKRVAARIHARQRVPGRDEDDIAQQIVLRILHLAQKFDPARGTAEAFAITAARSAAMDVLRGARRAKRDPRRVQLLSDAVASKLETPRDSSHERADVRVLVERAVSQLETPDADVARDLQRFGANNARKRLGSSRPQWSQTKERIRLTLEAENVLESSEIRRRRARRGVSK